MKRQAALGLFPLLVLASMAQGQEWGHIKGQVIWGPDKLPAARPVAGAGVIPCLKGAQPVIADYEVDKDSKGVKWVMAWLADAREPKNAKAKIPINPALMPLLQKTVSFDQPCCTYEPHVFGIWAGQPVLAKNSAPMAHSVKIEGGDKNPTLSIALQPGQNMPILGWNPTLVAPVPIACAIHPWMSCYARVFNHPYFAVTNDKGEFEIKDAPAGDFRLIVWHPEKGWLAGRTGMAITIKANDTLDLGKIKLVPDEK